jgi:tetraacyldisaccharide 4'-kinase
MREDVSDGPGSSTVPYLQAVWYGSKSGWPLRPLSWLYAAVQRVRSAAYRRGIARSKRVGRPVVVVGNLTAGGTGKTPLVAWLAQALGARGLRVGIVSRGYGRARAGLWHVHPQDSWRQAGDEPLMLARRTGAPVVVAADRVAGARELAGIGVDVVLADDGLQHLRLARDVEIVVVDAARGFGNGRLLPAGPLREPLSRLRSVDAIVLNGDAMASGAVPGAGDVPLIGMKVVAGAVLPVDGGAAEPIERYRGREVHAVAGIGHPARFFDSLRSHGITVRPRAFPDHHAFQPRDVQFRDALPVLMTEKDAVKCAGFGNPRLHYVQATAQLAADDADRLLDRILRHVK